MADNYLEKKMDDYRRGIAYKAPRRSSYNTTKSSPAQRVAMIISDGDLLSAILTLSQAQGNIKASFISSDSRCGTRLAQSTGSLFVPAPDFSSSSIDKLLHTLEERWGGVDILITDTPAILATPLTIPVILFSFLASQAHPTGPTSLTSSTSLTSPTSPVDHTTINQPSTTINIPNPAYDRPTIARAALLLLTAPSLPVASISLR